MKRLTTGQIAPTFDGTLLSGETFSLRNVRGRKIHLSFFRNAACPLCNLRVFKLGDHVEKWRARGLESVALFESPVELLTRSKAHQLLRFPLLADPERTVYTLYGLELNWARTMMSFLFPGTYVAAGRAWTGGKVSDPIPQKGDSLERLPGEFLIDENGVIVDCLYGSWMGHFLPIARIDAFAQGAPD